MAGSVEAATAGALMKVEGVGAARELAAKAVAAHRWASPVARPAKAPSVAAARAKPVGGTVVGSEAKVTGRVNRERGEAEARARAARARVAAVRAAAAKPAVARAVTRAAKAAHRSPQ